MDMRFLIQGGINLVSQEGSQADWNESGITLRGSRIECIGAPIHAATSSCATFDATGLLVLPGMVDIHGDAFERQIQPRPATTFSYEIALADTDRQLISNGITTAFHGVTYSWEGGLRGRDAALALMDQVSLQRKTAQADHKIHLRFENHHIDGLQDALDWIAQGRVGLFSFNEHLPSITKKSAQPERLAAYAERARCDIAAFLKRLRNAQARAAEVPGAVAQLAAICRERGIPMTSHDDESSADREHFQALGVFISEFPKTHDALLCALGLDNRVVMGAPNVLLGGSHCDGLAAIDAVRSGMCDILASDYYYPALLHAPFILAHEGACSLAKAWDLVSSNPAHVLGLHDRGRIAEGRRADLALVETQAMGRARLIATIAAGKLVYCAEPERFTMQHGYLLAA